MTRPPIVYTDNKIVMCTKAHSLKTFLKKAGLPDAEIMGELNFLHANVPDDFYQANRKRDSIVKGYDMFVYVSTTEMNQIIKEIQGQCVVIDKFVESTAPIQHIVKKSFVKVNEIEVGIYNPYTWREVEKEAAIIKHHLSEHNHSFKDLLVTEEETI